MSSFDRRDWLVITNNLGLGDFVVGFRFFLEEVAVVGGAAGCR
jgi:hypothetical protein